MRRQKQKGFTIVELLIVIVVIGILAAIVIVAYSGVAARGRNAARIAAAQQIVDLVSAYKAANGQYPPAMNPSNGMCLTIDNVCTDYSGTVVTNDNSDLITQLRTIGTPPRSANKDNQTAAYGLYFDTYPVRQYEGQSAPGLMMYWLEGTNQDCKLQDVVTVVSSPPYPGTQVLVHSTTGYTYSDTNPDVTSCWVSI